MQADEKLVNSIVDAVLPFLRHHGICCCGATFEDREAILKEMQRRVREVFNPSKPIDKNKSVGIIVDNDPLGLDI